VTRLQRPSAPWLLLGLAMAVSATWILLAGHGLSFNGDEIFYYANLVVHGGSALPAYGLEYFLAPHNGHLVLVGRLVYRLLFELAGTDYFVFRAVEVAGFLVCVGLFFVLARRRTTSYVALAFSISLLFLGYAYESLLWPFDLHTVFSLALGLGALLALEREDRKGDIAVCALLILSVATLEVGLAFVVGVAVSVLLRSDRARRAWVFLVPVALYAAWWLWARKFDQPAIELTNVHLIPIDLSGALAAVGGSLFGLNPTGSGVAPEQTTITAAGTVVAGFAVAGLVYRVRRGGVPPTLWVSLAVVVTYWVTIAMGGRPPDSSRYILVGAVMVLLVAADALRGVRFSPLATAGFFCVVALAIPANVAKLYDGRAVYSSNSSISGTEYAMLDLERHRVDPEYIPATDPAVAAVGGSIFVPLSASNYFRAERNYGSLGLPLKTVRGESLQLREIADASVVGALGIHLHPVSPPADPGRCPSVTDASPQSVAYFAMAPGGVLLGSRGQGGVAVSVSRFGHGGPGTAVGELGPGQWATLKTPSDGVSVPWQALVDGPVYVCPLP
jgi:hypothetical protein